jgi:hypothetical protein
MRVEINLQQVWSRKLGATREVQHSDRRFPAPRLIRRDTISYNYTTIEGFSYGKMLQHGYTGHCHNTIKKRKFSF